MDQGLKERLIGAAVLVALGVWLIPLVLNGPAEQAENGAAALQLPVAEESQPVKSVTIRLDEQKHPPGTGAADTDPEPPVAEVADNGRAPEPAPATAPASAVQAPPAAPPPARPTPAAAAPETAAKAATTEGFMIQLGSFSEEENARRLAQRVSAYGYKPAVSTFKSSGRVMWRVRIGPKPTRAQAEAEASSLSAHGFVAQVVSAD
jgi:DedD protein